MRRAALAVIFSTRPMPYVPPLQKLRQQFEELATNLEVCRNPSQRRELLKRMKIVIEETDKLISTEVHLSSAGDRIDPS
jgi:hypothetical protein